MQCKRWICGGMLYGVGTFLLCGDTDLRPIGKDDEAQVVETNVAEANEDPIVPKIDCLIDAMRKGDSEEALQLIGGIEDKDIDRRGRFFVESIFLNKNYKIK